MITKKNRCWPGYEPVPGKTPHEQGSCGPKAGVKLKPGERDFREKRRKQLDKWQAQHPSTHRSAAQHLHAPGTKTQAATRQKRESTAHKSVRRKKRTNKSKAN